MDVSGTIDKILRQKSGQIWSIPPDATVYEAIALMAEKNIGALLEKGVVVGANVLLEAEKGDIVTKGIQQWHESAQADRPFAVSFVPGIARPHQADRGCGFPSRRDCHAVTCCAGADKYPVVEGIVLSRVPNASGRLTSGQCKSKAGRGPPFGTTCAAPSSEPISVCSGF